MECHPAGPDWRQGCHSAHALTSVPEKHTHTQREPRETVKTEAAPKHTLHFPLNKNCSSCFQQPSSCKIRVRYLPVTRQQQMDKV